MPNPNPTVSVLTTVYNREKFLRECLESTQASSWEDFEVIMVDDGSKDGSVAIMDEFAAKDPRFKSYQNDKNLGDYPNRRKAASLAKGKYIKYVDADDVIYPHSLELMVKAMESNPEAALGIAHSLPEDNSPYPWCLTNREAYEKHFLGRGCLSCGPSGAIIRKGAYEEIDGFRAFGVATDHDFWLRIAARWSVVLLPPALIWWRRHDGQEFKSGPAEMEYLCNGYVIQRDALSAPECPLSEQDRAKAIEKVRQHHARRILATALRRRKPKLALTALKKSNLSFGDLLTGLKGYS
ncbi:MAG: glycosyltransferase family 2 protein [Verrucomicrobiota bacterium]